MYDFIGWRFSGAEQVRKKREGEGNEWVMKDCVTEKLMMEL